MRQQMNNNPMAMLMQAVQRGANPMQMMAQMAGQNPQAAQAMRIIQGKSPQELEQIARNMAREQGISLDDMARQMGMQIPNK